MTRRLPFLATVIVLAAVGVMIALGAWQLQRASGKEALLARYAQAQDLPPIVWPAQPPRGDQLPLFRHATGMCPRIVARRAQAGENAQGEPGYVHIVDCAAAAGAAGMSVEVGWSKDPNAPLNWAGGPVSGVIAPDRRSGMRLVAASAPPGLEPSRPPSPETIRNNHRSYALQWFAFAAIALLIFGLALRGRLRQSASS
ncbi:MAG TPA: SURF1 family cytochrome oxidase biogenesis protein [Sphingomicrobium sp.]|nr:SURF1 family cytochrome oxidase biogenesis protein [Sphingomicrobium sp.]